MISRPSRTIRQINVRSLPSAHLPARVERRGGRHGHASPTGEKGSALFRLVALADYFGAHGVEAFLYFFVTAVDMINPVDNRCALGSQSRQDKGR